MRLNMFVMSFLRIIVLNIVILVTEKVRVCIKKPFKKKVWITIEYSLLIVSTKKSSEFENMTFK